MHGLHRCCSIPPGNGSCEVPAWELRVDLAALRIFRHRLRAGRRRRILRWGGCGMWGRWSGDRIGAGGHSGIRGPVHVFP